MKAKLDKTITESKRAKSFGYFFILYFGLFFTVLSIFIFVSEHQENLLTVYRKIELLVFVIACGLTPVFYILVVDKIIVNNTKIRVYSYWGYKKRDIYLNEVVSWNEINVKSKYGNYNILIFRTNNFKYKIQQYYYNNYIELKNQIVRGKNEGLDNQANYDKKKSREDTYIIIGFTILILTLFFITKYLKN